MDIILCSGSLRRQELLKEIYPNYILDCNTNFDENINLDEVENLEELPLILSRGKNLGFYRELNDNEILITADTLVLCDNHLLGKPKDEEMAYKMLKSLSNKNHKVITGVTIRTSKEINTFGDYSDVHFIELSDKDIHHYIEKYRPYDKAGSYGIQEWIGFIGIDYIKGSYFNIMGLPTHLIYKEIESILSRK